MGKLIRVVATERGQKLDRTWAQPGDAFDIDEKLFSPLWMAKAKAEKPKPAPKKS